MFRYFTHTLFGSLLLVGVISASTAFAVNYGAPESIWIILCILECFALGWMFVAIHQQYEQRRKLQVPIPKWLFLLETIRRHLANEPADELQGAEKLQDRS